MGEHVFDQKRPHNHPHTVMHIPCFPHLAQTRINNGVACEAFVPCGKFWCFFYVPWKLIKFFLQVFPCDIREVVKQIIRKLSPAKLTEEVIHIFFPTFRSTARLCGVPCGVGRYLAKVKVRGEA